MPQQVQMSVTPADTTEEQWFTASGDFSAFVQGAQEKDLEVVLGVVGYLGQKR